MLLQRAQRPTAPHRILLELNEVVVSWNGAGMDALVTVFSWNTNGMMKKIMVWIGCSSSPHS